MYGADSKLRFKSVYKYDDAGRQTQEIQSDKSDNVLHKIVYTYDSLGKPTGYAVYDGAGQIDQSEHRSETVRYAGKEEKVTLAVPLASTRKQD